MHRRYGGLFRTKEPIAGELFHVGDPALIEQMFRWKPEAYEVAEPRELMEPAVGRESLLLLDGQRHLRMRKLMLPAFHGEAIAGYSELIQRITDAAIDGWTVGETIQTRSVAQEITMSVIIEAVFGITDPRRIAEFKFHLPRLTSVNPAVLLFQRDLGPRSPWGRFLRHRDRVDAMLYEEIRNRRDRGLESESFDVLTMLMAARDEAGSPLTDKELRDELITLLLAGHETTATSIGWAFERLLRTPAAKDRLVDELQAGAGGEYLDAVIKETLRVRPVVTEVFRSPTGPVELGGYRFEAGQQLCVAIAIVQLDPKLFAPDSELFRPERFLNGTTGDPYTWVPFGGGVRRCIGAAFAQLEMKVVIEAILSRARLEVSNPKSEKPRFRGVTVLPSRGGEALVRSVMPSRSATPRLSVPAG